MMNRLRLKENPFMLKQDYLTGMIHDMTKLLLKLLFHIDDENFEDLTINDTTAAEKYTSYLKLADEGNINEAENLLYDSLNPRNNEELKTAFMFYNHLNRLDNKALEESNFSREEIQEGLQRVLELFGYQEFAETVAQDLFQK